MSNTISGYTVGVTSSVSQLPLYSLSGEDTNNLYEGILVGYDNQTYPSLLSPINSANPTTDSIYCGVYLNSNTATSSYTYSGILVVNLIAGSTLTMYCCTSGGGGGGAIQASDNSGGGGGGAGGYLYQIILTPTSDITVSIGISLYNNAVCGYGQGNKQATAGTINSLIIGTGDVSTTKDYQTFGDLSNVESILLPFNTTQSYLNNLGGSCGSEKNGYGIPGSQYLGTTSPIYTSSSYNLTISLINYCTQGGGFSQYPEFPQNNTNGTGTDYTPIIFPVSFNYNGKTILNDTIFVCASGGSGAAETYNTYPYYYYGGNFGTGGAGNGAIFNKDGNNGTYFGGGGGGGGGGTAMTTTQGGFPSPGFLFAYISNPI
jgi:hypothetical protein